MNILFEFPFAFAAFTALPVLVAIYLLRNRFRQVPVSSLMLWVDQRRHKQGGLNLDRLQTPLLFLLELLILTLLALAAVGPLVHSRSQTRRLVMVLDDSLSMSAEPCRQNALKEIKRYLKASAPFQVTFLGAGLQPRVLAAELDNLPAASAALERWRCLSPAADLEKALAAAGQIADRKARIILITDHLPPPAETDSQYEYWSFGRPLNNAGFLHAERTQIDGRDRCLLTIGNFSPQTHTIALTIESLDGTARLYENRLEIPPSEPFQMIFEPPSNLDLVAFLPADALEADNRVILLRPQLRPVRTAVSLRDEPLDESVTKILDAIPDVRRTPNAPDLLITDTAVSDQADASLLWTLQIESDPNTSAFVGPFIMDRNHPLTEGLELEGVIWSAAKRRPSLFVPIISAGNTTLLEARPGLSPAPHLRLFLNPQRSTLLQSPNWPILLWNLVHWRQQQLPGLHQSNYRIGAPVAFEVPAGCTRVRLTDPDGRKQEYENPAGTLLIEAETPGLYQLTADESPHPFAVNAVAAGESDLQTCRLDSRVPADQAAQFWWEYRPVDWILLLIALLFLTLHRYLVHVQTKGGGA